MGHPWRPHPTDAPLSIEAGNQGGFHVEPSFRLSGSFDPDLITVSAQLAGPDGPVAESHESDLYLWLRAGACDHDLARLVLVDEAGALLDEAAVSALTGAPLTLSVSFESGARRVEASWTIQLQ